MSFNEFKSTYDTNILFTTYYGIKQAIHKLYLNTYNSDMNKIGPNILQTVQILVQNKTGSKAIYDYFIKENKFNTKYQEKWELELQLDSYNWERCNDNIFSVTQDRYFQWMQYRIIHRILGTNKSLYVMQIKSNPMCTFCKVSEESIIHLFCEYQFVTNILSQLQNLLSDTLNDQIIFSKCDVILGFQNAKNKAINTILLVFKKYIYETKMKEQSLCFNVLKIRICDYISNEEYICRKNCNIHKFHLKWENFESIRV